MELGPSSRRPQKVALRFSLEGAQRVELAGEVSDWLAPRAVPPRPAPPPGGAGAVYEAELSLPAGVYAYKLKVDGAWTLDPHNPRTRAVDGYRNSVLSVGGAPEPLLFAPAPPFVHAAERGGVVLTCALRRGEGEALAVRWSEGSGALDARAPMHVVHEEEEHLVFRAQVPWSAARVRYAFELVARGRPRLLGCDDHLPFVYERQAAEDGAPRWWREAIVCAVGPADAQAALAEFPALGATVLHLTLDEPGDAGDLSELAARAFARGARLVVDLWPSRGDALETALRWAALGVSGVCLRAAAQIPFEHARTLRRRLRAAVPDAVVVGELDRAHAWRWRQEEAIDCAIDGGFEAVVAAWLADRTLDARAACRRLRAVDLWRGPAHAALRSLARGEALGARLPLAMFLLVASSGVPSLRYEAQGALPLARTLLALRAASPALGAGDVQLATAGDGVLAVRREAGGEAVDLVLNGADERSVVLLDDPAGLEELSSWGDVELSGLTLTLGPGAAWLARRRAPLAATAMPSSPDLGAGRGGRADAAIVETPMAEDVVAVPRPTRLDLALTERCDFTCGHCVDHAPDRTRTGAARRLSPFVLDRLRDALATTELLDLGHGGEPLGDEALFEVLDALRVARAGRPAVAHVTTHGMRLDAEMTERLAAAGLRSLAVSLDGATAAVNDALRPGGSFARIVANLEEAARRRARLGADLRLGIRTAVMRQNLAQLSAIVELAARFGVDWVSLEAVRPVNALAARSLVRMDAHAARSAVDRACARGRELGVVVVDRADDRAFCPAEPDGAERLAAASFAARVPAHSCLDPSWRACVSPDGEVRLGSFAGPVLGNVTAAPLGALWTGEIARSSRALGADRPCYVRHR